MLKAQGNIKDAYLYFQRALEIDEAFFGPSHPEVALRSFILGDLLSDLGGLNEARLHYHRALQIIESFYGPDNLDVAVVLNNLGKTAKAQGEPADARAFFARAHAIFRDNLGENHPCTISIEEHLDTLPQAQLPQENADDDDYGFYF